MELSFSEDRFWLRLLKNYFLASAAQYRFVSALRDAIMIPTSCHIDLIVASALFRTEFFNMA